MTYSQMLTSSCYPIVLNSHVFAAIIRQHGDEAALETIAHWNSTRRARRPSGLICTHCQAGHQDHCSNPTFCDCYCHR